MPTDESLDDILPLSTSNVSAPGNTSFLRSGSEQSPGHSSEYSNSMTEALFALLFNDHGPTPVHRCTNARKIEKLLTYSLIFSRSKSVLALQQPSTFRSAVTVSNPNPRLTPGKSRRGYFPRQSLRAVADVHHLERHPLSEGLGRIRRLGLPSSSAAWPRRSAHMAFSSMSPTPSESRHSLQIKPLPTPMSIPCR
jgi:hypothetical protein